MNIADYINNPEALQATFGGTALTITHINRRSFDVEGQQVYELKNETGAHFIFLADGTHYGYGRPGYTPIRAVNICLNPDYIKAGQVWGHNAIKSKWTIHSVVNDVVVYHNVDSPDSFGAITLKDFLARFTPVPPEPVVTTKYRYIYPEVGYNTEEDARSVTIDNPLGAIVKTTITAGKLTKVEIIES